MARADQTGAHATEHIRAALRESEERFRLIVESIQDYAIFMLDREGNVQTWNLGAERIKGYTATEIIGQHFSRFYRPEDRWRCAELLDAAEQDGRVEDEGPRVRKDGSTFWANVVITALRDDTGDLVGFAKVTRDLTERRRAEERLRESEETFRLLVESVKDYAIYRLDVDGTIRTWNEGARRIKGYAPDEIIGRHFSVFYPPEDAWKWERELEVAARDGRFEEEGIRVRKNGERFWADVILTAVHDPTSGKLVGFAKVTRDLTERRRAEQERMRLAEAEHANRVKDEFLATVSHELRTPLNAILGWSILLSDRVVDPAIAKPLTAIRRNAEAQAKIIEDVLDVSRIVTGKLRLDVRAVDLASVVRDATDVVRPAADAKRITLLCRGLDVPARTTGDATRLQQVAWNLLSNAVKFSPSGTAIEIELTQEEEALVLRVSDQGAGIDSAFLPHVFDPFRQADGSPARKHGGLGLGLAIVRHIVELHGGSVVAASAGLDKGSTFVVTLPRRILSEDASSSSGERARTARLDGFSIVVVDDDDDSRLLVETTFSTAGARVRVADSAERARAMLLEETPDVLVTDIAMPDEDGYELLVWVRAHERAALRTVPAIAITAHAREIDRARARAIGFDAHVAKPIDPTELVRVVRRIASR